MGLDITCECGRIAFRAGSYTYFHNWRRTLARIVGINLDQMAGFNGCKSWTGHERFYELLNHSDCDGKLTPLECLNLKDDFEWLEKLMTTKNSVDKIYRKIFNPLPKLDTYWLEKFQHWKNAIEHSVEENCKIIFC